MYFPLHNKTSRYRIARESFQIHCQLLLEGLQDVRERRQRRLQQSLETTLQSQL